MGFGKRVYLDSLSDSLFSFSWKKRPLLFRPLFQARPQLFAEEQGFKVAKFQGAKVAADGARSLTLETLKALKPSRKRVAQCLTTNCGAGNADGHGETSLGPSATIVSLLWKLPTTTTRCAGRLAARAFPGGRRTCGATPNFSPPPGYEARLPVGFTPLFQAPRLAEQLSGTTAAAKNLYIKNDAVCLPTLSFKDRVVAVALSQAKAFGFDTVSCSSTGNLANAVAAQAAREGLKAWIFIPSDLEPAKILGHQRIRRESGAHRGQLRSGEPVCARRLPTSIVGASST